MEVGEGRRADSDIPETVRNQMLFPFLALLLLFACLIVRCVACVCVLACEHATCVYGGIFHPFLVSDAESLTEPRAHQFWLT